jgi:transcription elongation factor Elf1
MSDVRTIGVVTVRQREEDRPVVPRVPRLLKCPRCAEERLLDTDELGHHCDVCGFGWRL